MAESIIKKLNDKINKLPKGKIIFITDFASLGNDVVIRQSLKRLTNQKRLLRLAQGIYYRPKENKLLGTIHPTAEQIAEAIAKRDKARIVPTGSYALYKLGLSTQIPMNVVYLTDGSARKIKVGNQKITLKKTSPKNLAVNHKLSNLIIQGLRELRKENVTAQTVQKIKKIIEKSGESETVKKNIVYAPVWIQKIVLSIIEE